jgi:hypothetical protein
MKPFSQDEPGVMWAVMAPTVVFHFLTVLETNSGP